MLEFLCALLIVVPLDLQSPSAPDPARVKSALAQLDKAFKEGQGAERTKAIQDNRQVLDADVIRSIARGIEDRDAAVARAAIDALRFMEHPEALKMLHDAAAPQSPLRKDPELYAAIVRAIGQHASPTSIPLLKEDIWTVQDFGVVQARIMSLGRIRTIASVEALILMMRTGGPLKIQPFMEDFRIALAVLTGVDEGRSQDFWMHWWNDNREKLKIDPKPAPIEKALQKRWDSYWRSDARDGRSQKRPATGRDAPDRGSGKQ